MPWENVRAIIKHVETMSCLILLSKQLALLNFEDYCTGDRSHFPAVEELYKTTPVGDGVYNVSEDSTVEFSNVSQVADSLTNCDNSFLVAQQGLFPMHTLTRNWGQNY